MNVLLRIYAKCLVGQDEIARRQISEALREADDGNRPGGTGKRPSNAADDPRADDSDRRDSR